MGFFFRFVALGVSKKVGSNGILFPFDWYVMALFSERIGNFCFQEVRGNGILLPFLRRSAAMGFFVRF